MYDHLTGLLERLQGDTVVLDVDGVGFRLRVPSSTAARLRVGSPTRLFIAHRIRDEMLQLYGFSCQEERDIFERVCQVAGVGPAPDPFCTLG